MPAGLQAWDEAGNMTIDTTDNVGRFRGETLVTSSGSGSVAISKTSAESYFAFMVLTNPDGSGSITITSTGFNYTFSGGGSAYIYYGVV